MKRLFKISSRTRWEYSKMFRESAFVRWWTLFRLIILLLGLGGVALSAWGFAGTHNGPFDWRLFAGSFAFSAGPYLTGFMAAILVFDTLAEVRATRTRKRMIIEQMGSRLNPIALDAVRIARKEGWLEDGSFRKANLEDANLTSARIHSIDVQGAWLDRAQLQRTDLRFIRGEKAHFTYANLERATLALGHLPKAVFDYSNLRLTYFLKAELQGAKLISVNLYEADLTEAYLEGACLLGANLQGARLDGVFFDEKTILPDRTKWTPDVDLARFTDPNHPQFWRPEEGDYHGVLGMWKKWNKEK
jgi:hypothetical protein